MGAFKPGRSGSLSSEDAVTNFKSSDPGFDYELPKAAFSDGGLDPDAALTRLVSRPFSPEKLAAAFLSGCSAHAIKCYLQAYSRDTVTDQINTLVRQHRIITYAVERNSAEALQTPIEYGANTRAKDFGDVPILAFAIMRAKWTIRNATEVVKTLLTNGADYRCIPADMWTEYIKTPKSETEYKPSEPSLITRTKWCTPERRAILAETLNLTIRYYLWRASRFETHMKRTLQIASAHKMTAFLKMPFQVIGQEPATVLVLQNVYAHIALNVQKPLVLGFAGLSGHGKTELATQMGSLLSVPIIDLDCAQMGQLESLLGPSICYKGYELGSPFNNFLTENTGKRCVVFLDEFDKTEKKVREALLKAMDTGTPFNR